MLPRSGQQLLCSPICKSCMAGMGERQCQGLTCTAASTGVDRHRCKTIATDLSSESWLRLAPALRAAEGLMSAPSSCAPGTAYLPAPPLT